VYVVVVKFFWRSFVSFSTAVQPPSASSCIVGIWPELAVMAGYDAVRF
jgi:hypothetical protein